MREESGHHMRNHYPWLEGGDVHQGWKDAERHINKANPLPTGTAGT